MMFGRKKPDDSSGGGTQDPVGQNPTGNARRSSADQRAYYKTNGRWPIDMGPLSGDTLLVLDELARALRKAS